MKYNGLNKNEINYLSKKQSKDSKIIIKNYCYFSRIQIGLLG